MKFKFVNQFISPVVFAPLFLASCAATPIKTVHSVNTKSPKTISKTSPKKNVEKAPKKMTGQAPTIAQTAIETTNFNPLQKELNAALAYEASEQWLKSAELFSSLSIKAIAPKDQESSFNRALNLVQNRLTKEELEIFVDSSESSRLKSAAYLRLSSFSMAAGAMGEAEDQLQRAIDLDPGSRIALEAEGQLNTLKSLTDVEPYTIGAVLPLSGRLGPQGSRILRGLTMGLGIHSGSKFKIAAVDSEGTPEGGKKAVDRVIKEDNAIAIVGDILAKSAEAVALQANDYQVPVFTLSQKSGLTDIGDSVFRNVLTPQQQVRQLVRSSINDLGFKKFAIMYPNDAFGVEYANVFWDEVLARGGSITAVQSYESADKDFRTPTEKLLGVYYGEARQAEYYMSLREIKAADKKRSSRQSNNEVVLKPITDFDAIFIPDDAKNFGQIAAMISYYDVKEMKFLGPNLWNTSGIAKRTGTFGDNIFFVDTFINSTDEKTKTFLAEYRALYNEDPSLLEIQAYDTGLLLRQLIVSGADNRQALREKILELREYPGSVGTVKINGNRDLERPATTLTLKQGEIVPARVSE